ncbi:hypothetical protein ACVW1A_000050 [Bradyrhizobium sp. LB1.3]
MRYISGRVATPSKTLRMVGEMCIGGSSWPGRTEARAIGVIPSSLQSFITPPRQPPLRSGGSRAAERGRSFTLDAPAGHAAAVYPLPIFSLFIRTSHVASLRCKPRHCDHVGALTPRHPRESARRADLRLRLLSCSPVSSPAPSGPHSSRRRTVAIAHSARSLPRRWHERDPRRRHPADCCRLLPQAGRWGAWPKLRMASSVAGDQPPPVLT